MRSNTSKSRFLTWIRPLVKYGGTLAALAAGVATTAHEVGLSTLTLTLYWVWRIGNAVHHHLPLPTNLYDHMLHTFRAANVTMPGMKNAKIIGGAATGGLILVFALANGLLRNIERNLAAKRRAAECKHSKRGAEKKNSINWAATNGASEYQVNDDEIG